MPISSGSKFEKVSATVEKMEARAVNKHLMALAFVFLCSAFCRSQAPTACTNHLKDVELECQSSTCSEPIILHLPDDAGKAVIKYSCTSVSCCGELKTTCEDDGACDAAVHNPEVRARIEDVAKTSQILVADCDGRYAPYAPSGESAINVDRMLAADRILR